MTENSEKKKIFGKAFHGPTVLHGKRARLIRGENEVVGILLSNDHQINSDNFVFQYVDQNGVKCVSPVTSDELQDIDEALMDY